VRATVETDTKRLDHATALAKGQKLLALVRSTDGAVKQSPYVNSEALKTWGYETCVSSLRDMGGFSTSLLDLGIQNPGDDCTIVQTEHIQDVTINGILIPATRAEFSSTTNTRAGLLCAEYNFGPAYGASLLEWDADVPLSCLKHWSDVAFLRWSSLQKAAPGALEYVLRSRISECNTLAVIEELVASLPEEHRYLSWPGISFDMEHNDHAKALLGTPNGSGVAWLLAQHRSQLCRKSIAEVRLFYSKEPLYCPRYRNVSLLFCILEAKTHKDDSRAQAVTP
jgi:hypothetical protein